MKINKKKSIFAVLFAVLIGFSFILSTKLHAEEKINLEFNNKKVMDESQIYVINGSSYAKADKISSLLNLNYFWQEETETLYFSKIIDNKETILYFCNKDSNSDIDLTKLKERQTAVLSKGFSFEYETEKTILRSDYILINDELFVPVKIISDSLNYKLDWDSFSKTVMLQTVDEEKLPKRDSLRIKYTQDDFDLMAKLVNIEARDSSVNKKLAVANVILNRVESSRFPNTIKEVIYQSGQFPPAHKNSFKDEVPSQTTNLAVKKALYNKKASINGIEFTNDILFFNCVRFRTKSADEFFGEIEGDYFYY